MFCFRDLKKKEKKKGKNPQHMPSEEKDAYNKIAIENRVRRDIYKNSVKMVCYFFPFCKISFMHC